MAKRVIFSSQERQIFIAVLANDSDAKRAYMLVHQLQRINSPAVFVTSCDAQFFPILRSDKKNPTEGGMPGGMDDMGGLGTHKMIPIRIIRL